MHFTRQAMRGRLSEFLGDAALASDARMRVYGLSHVVEEAAGNLSEADRAYFQAYADGVNALMESGRFAAPPEFMILRVRFEPWTVEDTLLVYKAIALDLINGEFFRAGARARLTPLIEDRVDEFLPAYPEDGPTILSEDELNVRGEAPSEAIEVEPLRDPTGDPREGSNNWVVSGARTTTGQPFLANDPHLSHRMPGIWYLARVQTPDGVLTGATLPGAPGVVLGHNGRIAWGFTNVGSDVADLVTGPEASLAVTETREEVIEIRGAEPVTLSVRHTADGVGLPRDWFSAAQAQPLGQAAVLVWPLDDPGELTATVGRRIGEAGDIDSMLGALRAFRVPQQNIVFADVDGNIGYAAPAFVPVRGPDGAWIGEIPFEDLPQTVNPADGLIVTANNRLAPDSYPYFLTDDWSPEYRAARITELLNADRRLDKGDMRAVQTDAVSSWAMAVLPALWDAQPESPLGQEALAALRSWNGEMRPGWPEPLIFTAWMEHLSRAIYEDELGSAFADFHAPREAFMENAITGQTPAWCDDLTTSAEETCLELAGPALDAAVSELSQEYSPELETWRWGESHQAYFPHYPFSEIAILDGMFSARTPAPGDGSSVNVAHYRYDDVDYRAYHGPSYRAIYDLSDLDGSQYIAPAGQSGHFLSRHYRDMLAPWARGEYIAIRGDWDADAAPPGAKRLRLSPR